MLSIYRAGEIDLFENLDIVYISLLVVGDLRLATCIVQGSEFRVQGYGLTCIVAWQGELEEAVEVLASLFDFCPADDSFLLRSPMVQ